MIFYKEITSRDKYLYLCMLWRVTETGKDEGRIEQSISSQCAEWVQSKGHCLGSLELSYGK